MPLLRRQFLFGGVGLVFGSHETRSMAELGPPTSVHDTSTFVSKLPKFEANPQDFDLSVSDAGPAFRKAIAAIKANGGGRLVVPRNTYTFSMSEESHCLLIDFDKFKLDAQPGTIFKWRFYGLPLIAVIGANDVEIGSIAFVWNGIRGASPASADHFGYNGTGIISPPEWCSHIVIGGSNRVRLHDISWRGQTASNNLENGIAIWNGTAAGPSRAADVVENIIEDIDSNDVYFGVVAYGQDRFTFRNWISDRYPSGPAHVGPGHFLYYTSLGNNGIIENLEDKATVIDGVQPASSWSYQFRNISNCIVRNLKSRRPNGFGAILNECSRNVFEHFAWEADRAPHEASLLDVPAMIIAQDNHTSTHSRNHFRGWIFHDVKNDELQRSANCSIISQGGNTYSAVNAFSNDFDINIVSAPDKNYSQTICSLFGQHSSFHLTYTNNGTATKQAFRLAQDHPSRPSAYNSVTVRLKGLVTAPDLSIPGPLNHVYIDTVSAVPNRGHIGAGNTVSRSPR